MKLNPYVITSKVGGKQIMVSAEKNGFHGMVRYNKTAAFIIDQLKSETTREDIIRKMLDKYDASEEEIAENVDIVLNTLRQIHALEEQE